MFILHPSDIRADDDKRKKSPQTVMMEFGARAAATNPPPPRRRRYDDVQDDDQDDDVPITTRFITEENQQQQQQQQQRRHAISSTDRGGDNSNSNSNIPPQVQQEEQDAGGGGDGDGENGENVKNDVQTIPERRKKRRERTRASIRAWGNHIAKENVKRDGFLAGLEANAGEIARLAVENPDLMVEVVDEWIRSDPQTRAMVVNNRNHHKNDENPRDGGGEEDEEEPSNQDDDDDDDDDDEKEGSSSSSSSSRRRPPPPAVSRSKDHPPQDPPRGTALHENELADESHEPDGEQEKKPPPVTRLSSAGGGGHHHDTWTKPSPPIDGVVEENGEPVKVFVSEPFQNWGYTVSYRTSYTFVPRTKIGIRNIVLFAKNEGLRVRVAGSRHSWSDIFGKDGDVLISMMEIGEALAPQTFLGIGVPDRNDQDKPLENISFDGGRTPTSDRAYARVGAAATSAHFLDWLLDDDGGDWEWMLPALPLIIEVTSAGWTQPICHGAGISHPAMSDYVVEMEIVNCNGDFQTIVDPEQMKAVSGGFGLMGVVVSQVFELIPLKIADFNPRKIPTLLAIPPLERSDVVPNKDFDVDDFTDEQLENAVINFEKDCMSFYSQWLWFPFQSRVFVNAWDAVDRIGDEKPEYPEEFDIKIQEFQAALGRIFENSLARFLDGELQARLIGIFAILSQPDVRDGPDDDRYRTSVPAALHSRRGVHNLEVRDIEVIIEIPQKDDGAPDFSICRQAWWIAIGEVYNRLPEEVPLRTAVEMRMIGPSQTTLAPQRNNDVGSCALNLASSTLVPDADWADFITSVAEQWSQLPNTSAGRNLWVLPHWAKEWPETMGGQGEPILDYLKRVYEQPIEDFTQGLSAAITDGGCTLQDSIDLFGNEVMVDFLGLTMNGR